MDELRFCFGNLCRIVNNNSKSLLRLKEGRKNRTQDNIIYLLYGCVLDADRIETFVAIGGTYASKIFNFQRKVALDVAIKILDPNNETHILEYITEYIYQSVNWVKLIQELVNYCSQVEKFTNEVDVGVINDDLDEQINFFLKCLRYVVNEDNDYLSKAKRKNKELIDKYDNEATTFLKTNECVLKGKSVWIQLEGDCLKMRPHNIEKGTLVFHHFEKVLQFILRHGLVLVRIKVNGYLIRVTVKSENYTFKQIPKQEYDNVISFIEPYVDKFEPKYSWKGRNIAQLVKAGFDKDVYLPYGYYDKEGNLIGFCDYKIHRDVIELGTLLVREDTREQGIANSLLLFFRLMFFNSRIFTGTHEENIRMKKKLLTRQGLRI